MLFFNNLKVGAKILAGTLIVLVLMTVVGGISIVRITQINATLNRMVNNDQALKTLSQQASIDVLQLQLAANRYIRVQNDADMKNYSTNLDALNALLVEMKTKTSSKDQITQIDSIAKDLKDYDQAFNSISILIKDRKKLFTVDMQLEDKLYQQKEESFRSGLDLGVGSSYAYYLTTAEKQFQYMRNQATIFMIQGDKDYSSQFTDSFRSASGNFTNLGKSLTDSSLKAQLDEVIKHLNVYGDLFNQLSTNFNQQNDLAQNKLEKIGPQIIASSSAISASVDKQVKQTANDTQSLVSGTVVLMIVTILIAAALGLAAGLYISRSITQPLNDVTRAALGIAEGDINQTIVIQRNDEIGSLASAFGRMTSYIRAIAEAQDLLSQGDLTVAITPKSEKDVLGQAFVRMIANLRGLIGGLSENIGQLNTASGQLAAAANQTGEATGQISATIQQIAKGIQTQTESINQTATSVSQMKRAIDGVAHGAQEQAASVSNVSNLTNHITESIQMVSSKAKNGEAKAKETTLVARNGVKIVGMTLVGMNTLKEKVNNSAIKVSQMGESSQKIGAIVSTIDDIASQTNLLALNAAIEAARAGEHGKGFAVVADEVRKLAEKSAHATREIAELVKSIDVMVTEAIKAMNEGKQAAESSAVQALEAGKSLDNILAAVDEVNVQVRAIAESAGQIDSSSGEMINSVDNVNAIVEENTASTEEMAASSNEVTSAVENIASVSEENSAAVEEVSASSEEVSAQIQEVSQAAQNLSEMARSLQSLVARFKLEPEQRTATTGGMDAETLEQAARTPELIAKNQSYTDQPCVEIA
jgi:methyl-accepting chemotaxis protein